MWLVNKMRRMINGDRKHFVLAYNTDGRAVMIAEMGMDKGTIHSIVVCPTNADKVLEPDDMLQYEHAHVRDVVSRRTR